MRKMAVFSMLMIMVLLFLAFAGMNTATGFPGDPAYVIAINPHPETKPEAVTYDYIMMAEITDHFAEKYNADTLLDQKFITADKNRSQTYVRISSEHKVRVLKKPNRLILCAGIQERVG